jgi:hypothetical protein
MSRDPLPGPTENLAAQRRPPAALRDAILAKAKAKRSPTVRDVGKQRALLVLAALVPAAIVLAAMGIGPKGRPLALASLVTVGWSAVAVAASALVFSGKSPLGPSRPRMRSLALLAPVSLLVVTGLGLALFPDTWSGVLGPKNHASCMGLGLVMGLAPLASMLVHLRGTDPTDPAAHGAALGATAGTWAGVGTILLCSHHTAEHVLVGHVLPVLVFTALGALLGSRVLALKSA